MFSLEIKLPVLSASDDQSAPPFRRISAERVKQQGRVGREFARFPKPLWGRVPSEGGLREARLWAGHGLPL